MSHDTNRSQKVQQNVQQKVQEIRDPEFAAAVEEYAEAVVKEEMQKFVPGLESEQLHAGRVRQEARDAVYTFQKTFSSGFAILCEELSAQGKSIPVLSQKDLAIFDDPVAFMDAMEDGELYERLGFSSDTMGELYEIACRLTEAQSYDKGQKAFYFLAFLASQVAPFWLGLGYCNARMQNYEPAAEAFRQAIELEPENSEAYLCAINALLHLGKKEEATQLCEGGLKYAKESQAEQPGSTLVSTLVEAKQYIQSYT